MEQDTPSSRKARTVLLSVYLIYAGIFWACASSATPLASFVATCLLLLAWLPYIVFRSRKEWRGWMAIYITAIIAAPLSVFITGYVGLRDGYVDLFIYGATFLLIALFDYLGKRAQRFKQLLDDKETSAFLAERRKAPKRRPTMKFAGSPANGIK